MVHFSELQSSLYNIAYFQRGDVCRLCWTPGATTDLKKVSPIDSAAPKNPDPFSEPKTFTSDINMPLESASGEKKDRLKDLIAKITYSIGLDVEFGLKQNFPRKICEDCIRFINKFSNFKTACEQAEKRLREIFSTEYEEVKIERDFEVQIKTEPAVDQFLEVYNDSSCSLDEPLFKLKSKPENSSTSTVNISASTAPRKKKKSKLNLERGAKVKVLSSKPRSATYCNICHSEYGAEFADHNKAAHGVEEGGFRCFGCEKKFRTRKSRLAHEIKFCKGLKEGYRCAACGAYLPSRRTYESHARDHRSGRAPPPLPRPHFHCTPCLKTFKTRANLLQHIAVHQNKKNFVCEMCGRVFKRQDYLRKHILTHTGQKQYVCPHCGFRATQKSSLTVHIRKHTGERPFSCDICQQKCVSSSNLLAHRRRHDGLKKFECSLCGKKFGYKLSLEEHMASTHERLKTHVCKLCGATYSRQRGLRRHARVKHGERYDENAQDYVKLNEDELLKDLTTERPDEGAFLKDLNVQRPSGEAYLKDLNTECTVEGAYLKNLNTDRTNEGVFMKNLNTDRSNEGAFMKNLNTDRSNEGAFMKNLNTDRTNEGAFMKNLNTDRTNEGAFMKNLNTDRTNEGAFMKNLNTDRSNEGAFMKNLNTDRSNEGAFMKNLNTDRTNEGAFMKNLNTDRTNEGAFMKNLNTDRTNEGAFMKNLNTERNVDGEFIKDLNAERQNVGFLKSLTESDRFMKASNSGHRSEDNMNDARPNDYLKNAEPNTSAYIV